MGPEILCTDPVSAAGELGVEAVQGRGDALLRPLYNGKPKDHEDSETGVDVGDAAKPKR